MNKNSLLLAAGFSALMSVWNAQSNEIDQITQMMNAIEARFGKKVHAIVDENYSIVAKKATQLEQDSTSCVRSVPFEHRIDGDKTKTVIFHCKWELKWQYIVSQSLSKWQKLSNGSVCKDVKFYYLSVVDGILLNSKAAGIEAKKEKLVQGDMSCDEIN